MTLANSHWEYTREAQAKPKGLDLSFLRHFVGIFAMTFSAGSWFAILHFGFHVL